MSSTRREAVEYQSAWPAISAFGRSQPASYRQDTCGLARPSLIPSLVQLRSETFGAHRTEQAAEVTDPPEPRRSQVHRRGKRAGGNPSRVRISHPPPVLTRHNAGLCLGSPGHLSCIVSFQSHWSPGQAHSCNRGTPSRRTVRPSRSIRQDSGVGHVPAVTGDWRLPKRFCCTVFRQRLLWVGSRTGLLYGADDDSRTDVVALAIVRSHLSRQAPFGRRQAGQMLALRWNTLSGSYSALILASRSYLAAP